MHGEFSMISWTNLSRYQKTLKNVDLIYCEDTRRAKKLLSHFQITTPVSSYFLGNEHKKIKEVFAVDKNWSNGDVYLLKNIKI